MIVYSIVSVLGKNKGDFMVIYSLIFFIIFLAFILYLINYIKHKDDIDEYIDASYNDFEEDYTESDEEYEDNNHYNTYDW